MENKIDEPKQMEAFFEEFKELSEIGITKFKNNILEWRNNMINKIDELKQMETFKELLEAKITGLKEEIEEQEEQENKKFPQNGDNYFFIISVGLISEDVYDGNITDLQRLVIGNMFKTEKEAEFMVERLKVLKELKEFARPFILDVNNYSIAYNLEDMVMFIRNDIIIKDKLIYFESREKVREAIEAVGEERIKKYYFGIKE